MTTPTKVVLGVSAVLLVVQSPTLEALWQTVRSGVIGGAIGLMIAGAIWWTFTVVEKWAERMEER